MDTSSMFNAILKDFLGELRAAFPNNEGIHKAKKKLKNVMKISPKLSCNVFRESMKPFEQLITNRSDDFIFGEAGKMLKKTLSIDIEEIWKDANNETKDCIWNHINTLYMVSTKEVAITENTMNSIQELAKEMSNTVDINSLKNPATMKKTLEDMTKNIDTSAIHSIITQIDPNLANEMLPGLQSGELMKGVSDMIQNLDPSLLNSFSEMMENPQNININKIMTSMMGNLDPSMMMKMMGNIPQLQE